MPAARWLFIALLCFYILTAWTVSWWPTAVFHAGLAVLAVWIAEPILAGRAVCRWHWSLLLIAVPAILAALQIATGHAGYTYASKLALLHWSGLWILWFLTIQLFPDDVSCEMLQRALLTFGLCLIPFMLATFFSAGSDVYWHFPGLESHTYGPFGALGAYAQYMELILGMVLCNLYRRYDTRWRYLLAAAAIVGTVILAGSKAGSVVVIFELVLATAIAMVQGRWIRRAPSFLIVALVTISAAILLVGLQNLTERMVSFTGEHPDEFRLDIDRDTFAIFRSAPLWGVGLGNFDDVYPRFASFDMGRNINQAHSDWLQWAAEGGLPLFLTMLGLIGYAAIRATRTRWGVGLIAICLHAIVDFPFQRPGVRAWVIVLCALACIERRRSTPPAEDGVEFC